MKILSSLISLRILNCSIFISGTFQTRSATFSSVFDQEFTHLLLYEVGILILITYFLLLNVLLPIYSNKYIHKYIS